MGSVAIADDVSFTLVDKILQVDLDPFFIRFFILLPLNYQEAFLYNHLDYLS